METSRVPPAVPPLPAFLRLAGAPLRWALLYHLARSDYQVVELTHLVGERQNLVSYHLGRLRAEGLVVARRSSEDGRNTYYRAALERCAVLFAAAGSALHPALQPGPVQSAATAPLAGTRVLFLCTGNSARSQMAEALLREMGAGAIAAESAGDQPREVHANAVRAMRARGIDISEQRSRHLGEVSGKHFDWVVTLCDRVRPRVPRFEGASVSHWSVPDPVELHRPDAETLPAFEAAAAEIEARMGFFIRLAG